MNGIDSANRPILAFFLGIVFVSAIPIAQSEDAPLSIEANSLSVETLGAVAVVYHSAEGNLPERIVASGLSGEFSPDAKSLSLYTKRPDEFSIPPVIGRVDIATNGLAFYPRYPLQAGVPYVVALNREILGTKYSSSEESRMLFSFTIPKEIQEPVTTVKAVYPSSSELPENLLKFYIHFTHPMSGGDAYSHIRLLNEADEVIELPFLELGEELWDRENLRLTLLFDPGRIKSGLMPRREEGMVLEKGKRYTLQILDTWRDDQGRPLKSSFEKRFSATEPDGRSPRVDEWYLELPKADSKIPLRIDFPEPLDEALLQRLVEVVRNGGKPVAGRITVRKGERSWLFHPIEPWRPGLYLLRVGTVLEDLAGNSIGRAFEVDLEESQHRRPDPFVYREFRVH